MNKRFIFFSKLSLVLVLLVILAGSLVRMTEAVWVVQTGQNVLVI